MLQISKGSSFYQSHLLKLCPIQSIVIFIKNLKDTVEHIKCISNCLFIWQFLFNGEIHFLFVEKAIRIRIIVIEYVEQLLLELFLIFIHFFSLSQAQDQNKEYDYLHNIYISIMTQKLLKTILQKLMCIILKRDQLYRIKINPALQIKKKNLLYLISLSNISLMSGRNRDNRNNRYNDEHDHRSPDRSRTREKPYNDRNNQQNRDYGNDQGRDRWQRGNSPRNDKEKRNYRNYNNNNYNNRNRDWNQESKREVPKVFEMEVDVPKTFVLAEKGELKGKIITNLIIAEKQPQRLETSRLGELKSKITPIERIWTSHIKQYLNDSEFVQIHRKGRSLAYGQIEYGRSLIRYDERQNDICYDNKLYQAPIFSRAYFKLWQILKMGVLDKYENKQLTIGCIAEGPGGFIHALIDYRQKQHAKSDASPKDHFHAITLKIDSNTRNAKDWSDSRGTQLFSRLRKFGWKIGLSYGSTGTGNLLLRQNIQHFQKQVGKKCLVVTGDGGIECIGDKQFQYQEIFNAKLFFAEIITALHIQEVTGFFILKIYDCGFELTRQLILLLALYYKVQIVKPVTSRPGNSEKYLLCEDFAGIAEDELNELKRVLQEWTKAEPNLSYFENKTFLQNVFDFKNMQNYDLIYERIKQANDVFVKQQEFKLEEGLNLAARLSNVEQIEEQLRKSRFQEQVSFAYAWCKKYGLSTIDVQVTTKGTVNEQI